MSLIDTMPHTATAKRRRRTNDGMLGPSDSYPTVLFSGRSCWRQPASDTEKKDYAQRDIQITNKIFFNSDPQLTANDIIEIANPNSGTDRFEVMEGSTPDASAGLGVVYRVMCQLLEVV